MQLAEQELDFEAARGAVGRARFKAVASASVFVTGPATARAKELAEQLRQVPLGFVFHVLDGSLAVQKAIENRGVLVFVGGSQMSGTVAFAKKARSSASDSFDVILVCLGDEVSDEQAIDLLSAGYDVVMPTSTSARVVYRQIASLVQKQKRSSR